MTNITYEQFGSIDENFNMIRILAKQKQGFNICHINAQSLGNKLDEFRYLFENSGIDAICVSETWFSNNIGNHFYEVNGYRVFRSDRYKHGGGVAIYVKNNIPCKINTIYNEPNDVEYIFIDVNHNGATLLLGCVYRPHKTIILDRLVNQLELLSASYSDIIIAGDFNCNLLADASLTTMMSSFSLFPVNRSRPTHFTNTNSTLLDVFFVGNKNKVLLYDQLMVPAFSKHDLIFTVYDFATQKPDTVFTYRDFKCLNVQALETDLNNIQWDRMYYLLSVDEQVSFINSIILHLYNKHVPLRTRTVRCYERQWFNNEIKLLIQHRDNIYRLWKRFRTAEYREQYRLARKAVVTKIKHDKSVYYSNKFNNAVDTKKKWKIIREIGIGKPNNREIDVDVNLLNESFVNIPLPTVNPGFYAQTTNSPSIAKFSFKCLNINDVVEGFYKVKSNAVGLDDINPRFIKILLPWIIHPIKHLYNTIITTSTFPKEWKYAKIIPVPKTNNEYRPISILPYLSKVFERIIYKQVVEYINQHNLLTDRQSGFRPQHSCLTALTNVIEDLRNGLEEGKISFLILLDHSKAFDTVHHSILCLKLSNMFNFSTTAVRLMSAYLSDRWQCVSNKELLSNPLRVIRGVPQGSVLGPLLYSIYANDIPQQLEHSKIQMYADDIQLYLDSSISSIATRVNDLNNDLNKLFLWATANGVRINPNKSKCIVICKSSARIESSIDVFLGGSKIEVVNSARNLGVVFNNKLTWSDHINQTCGRVYSMLRCLWSSQYYTPPKIRLLLAKSYLIPTLLYSSEIFSGCNSKDTTKLNTTFNNIVRYVFCLRRFDHVSQYSRRIFNVTLNNYLKIKNLVFLHKIVTSGHPKYLYNRLQFMRSNRGNGILQVRYRDAASERQFFILSIRLWNQLPPNVQTTGNANKFKHLLYRFDWT